MLYYLDLVFYGYPKTLDEIGKELDITRERVRQIEKRALYKLKLKYNPDFKTNAKSKK